MLSKFSHEKYSRIRKALIAKGFLIQLSSQVHNTYKELELSFVPANNKHAFKVVKIDKELR